MPELNSPILNTYLYNIHLHMYLIERMDMRVLVFCVLNAESYPNFNAPLDEEPFVDVLLQV